MLIAATISHSKTCVKRPTQLFSFKGGVNLESKEITHEIRSLFFFFFSNPSLLKIFSPEKLFR